MASASTSPLHETLQRLASASRVPVGGALRDRIDPARELCGLTEAIAKLERETSTPITSSPTLTEEARHRWVNSGCDFSALTSRQIRALCGEPAVATDPRFVRGLADLRDLPSKRQWLERLAESYFAEWRRMPEPAAIERTLQQAVRAFTGRSERLSHYWSGADSLFSAHAPDWLGTEMVRAGKSASDHLTALGIDPGSGLGVAAANAAVDAWAHDMAQAHSSQRRRASARERLTQFMTQILVPQTLDRVRLGRAVSALILYGSDGWTDELRKELGTYLLAEPRFGDPRLPAKRTNWETVEKPALERFIGWLARNDLLFFFNLVIERDSENQHRKAFWLNYIDQVVNSNVVLGELDRRRLQAQLTAEDQRKVATCSTLEGSWDTSAFLMQFSDGTIFVEFSKTGNALFEHSIERFAKVAGGIRSPRLTTSQLKDKSYRARIRHTVGWEDNARQLLARRGIRPT